MHIVTCRMQRTPSTGTAGEARNPSKARVADPTTRYILGRSHESIECDSCGQACARINSVRFPGGTLCQGEPLVVNDLFDNDSCEPLGADGIVGVNGNDGRGNGIDIVYPGMQFVTIADAISLQAVSVWHRDR